MKKVICIYANGPHCSAPCCIHSTPHEETEESGVDPCTKKGQCESSIVDEEGDIIYLTVNCIEIPQEG